MRLSLRFIVPLLIVLTAFAASALPLAEKLTIRWFVRDLDVRTTLIANTILDQVNALDDVNDRAGLTRLFARIAEDERTHAIAFCPSSDEAVIASSALPAGLRCATLDRFAAAHSATAAPANAVLISIRAMPTARSPAGRLVLVYDMSFVNVRSQETRRYLFYLFIGLAAAVSLITVVIAQVSWRGWVQGMRALMRGEGILRPSEDNRPEFSPIARDLRELIRDIEGERRPRDADHAPWSPATIRAILSDELRGQEVIVVSNREPYIHDQAAGAVTVRRPASGLVTALEPIMRTCGGTWIAHGSGSADRTVVDARDRIAVPPSNPSYHLRRIWLTPEEEAGYYYGLANEGLWPLCHIAHVRPVFRTSDWNMYRRVNERYARAVVAEATQTDPIVLVQDYHLALAPRMIRDALPDATIITFWHIPWPNPEAFAICPWRDELLDGLLGSSILGFHTQFHCNNFVDTVDRLLEARVDRETFTVSYRGGHTKVNRYPISIEWPEISPLVDDTVADSRDAVRRAYGLPDRHLVGIGVDRLDYTKGIEERFRAVERLLELRPQWVGRFSFIQIAAPSRTSIGEYEDYGRRVRALAERINNRFAGSGPPPILLKVSHHEPADIYRHYRAADVCFVSSLHDGMNLVAKEFITSRDDERGVLVLSQFTGAARELPEAMIVNPYDADQCALALDAALSMSDSEQRARMRLMRALVKEFNVYRWAGHMLIDAASMRTRSRLLRRIPETRAV